MKIFICGDCCPGGMLAYQDTYISGDLKGTLNDFDIRICTLEAAVGTDFSYEPSKMPSKGGAANICYIRNEDFYRLKELNFNLVSLANNHSVDLGVKGLENALQLLDENNIKHCGAGRNIEEAEKPAIFIDEHGRKIAFFAFCINGTFPYACNVADESNPGIYKADIDVILQRIRCYSQMYDQLVLLPHWGEEHCFFPPVECYRYARMMIDAGASAIFGSHSHNPGPFCRYKGKIISYAMGNFLFPDFMMTPPRPMFYPPQDVLKSFARVQNYPKKIDAPTISIWDEDSRIALNWVYETNKKNCSTYLLTVLSADNILYQLKKVCFLRYIFYTCFKIPLGNLIVRSSFYVLFYKILKRMR